MKQTINEWQFRDAFRDCGRGEQFSYEGLGLLYEWFEEYEESSGQEMELDVIAICCDFSEEDIEDIAANYDIDADNVEEYLHENTLLVGLTAEGRNAVYMAF